LVSTIPALPRAPFDSKGAAVSEVSKRSVFD